PRYPPPLHSFPTRRSSDLVRAVSHEYPQAADGLQAGQRPAGWVRHSAVDGNDTSHAVGHCQPKPIRNRCAFAEAHKVDALGVNVDRKSTRLNSSHLVISYA